MAEYDLGDTIEIELTVEDTEGGIYDDPDVTVTLYLKLIKVEIEVNNTPDPENDDIVCRYSTDPAGRPTIPCRARVQNLAEGNLSVTIANKAGGGEVRFPNAEDTSKSLSLPSNGEWVGFTISGQVESALMDDAIIQAHWGASGGNVLAGEDLTVLWIDSWNRIYADDDPQYGSTTAADYAGDDIVSDDDDTKAAHNQQHTYPNLAHLGLNKYKSGPRMGWGFEVVATVHPSDFDGGTETFEFEQDIAFKDYLNAGPNPFSSGIFSTAGAIDGNDGPPIEWQDVTPSDQGKVFFTDGPGLPWDLQVSTGDVAKTRNNFKTWFRYGDARCSDEYKYYVKFDMEKQAGTPAWNVLDNADKKSENDKHTSLEL